MKLLFDSFPVILFFIAYYASGKNIYLATGVTIVATLAQLAWVKFKHNRVDKMLLFSAALVVVFGGLTIWLKDPTFIKWKPTGLYLGFAATLLVSDFMFGKNFIRVFMEKQISLPDTVWRWVNASWAGFFIFMAALNIYVAYHYSEEAWVNFKMFGATGLMIVFVVVQGLLLSRHALAQEKE